MQYPHIIRLRGPWVYEQLSAAGEPLDSTPRQINLSDARAGVSFEIGCDCSTVRLRRRFQRPANLDADECVWLVAANIAGRPALWINGTRLDPSLNSDAAWEVSVMPSLAPSNELYIELARTAFESEPQADETGKWRKIPEFRLEIRQTGD